MPRMTGEVKPYIPSTAPLSYRLSNEVYALDGTCVACGSTLPKGSKGAIVAAVGGVIALWFFFKKK